MLFRSNAKSTAAELHAFLKREGCRFGGDADFLLRWIKLHSPTWEAGAGQALPIGFLKQLVAQTKAPPPVDQLRLRTDIEIAEDARAVLLALQRVYSDLA